MPSLNFVLPHWLYWGTLIVFPLVAMYMVRRQRERGTTERVSLFIAYLFWLTAGFMGVHRLYLRSLWGFAFVPFFLAALYVNVDIRDAREDVSRTRAAAESAHAAVHRIQPSPGVEVTPELSARVQQAAAAATAADADFNAAIDELEGYRKISRWLSLILLILVVADGILMPWLVRRANVGEAAARAAAPPPIAPVVTEQQLVEDPTRTMHTRVTDVLEWLNVRVGVFVAYWCLISVFVYYYEVIARFVFNSPTNWVHESMFLMFGMMYMLSGAYAYREDQHVRVDVIYSHFSRRGKAIADIFTSFFFFIFMLTMLWTGYKFAADAVSLREVSFTEWAVQYWPVKLTIPIGAALMVLQGISKLIKDIVLLTDTRA
ncbi:MAG TPA: TRAP transporter small permease subunit [Xanthobacteraceae bacterium]|jgi:TRAP-type mannitol/chloroaromatic compound transport system permease small subunit